MATVVPQLGRWVFPHLDTPQWTLYVPTQASAIFSSLLDSELPLRPVAQLQLTSQEGVFDCKINFK